MSSDFTRVLLENSSDVEKLNINIEKLDFQFLSKPLLIGGKAMEYYQIREAHSDIDFVITEEDYEMLSYKYPNYIKEIYDDFGVCKGEYELWKSICLFGYEFLSEGAIEEKDFIVISFEKLIFLKVLSINHDKSINDLYLMRDRMAEINTMMQDYY
ncbi:hypothetical protein [Clostridium sp.]|uniref:hypothetical protein n=1 Tax=Clostridium sp. TaxID=1506 RepID=UPI00321786D1